MFVTMVLQVRCMELNKNACLHTAVISCMISQAYQNILVLECIFKSDASWQFKAVFDGENRFIPNTDTSADQPVLI